MRIKGVPCLSTGEEFYQLSKDEHDAASFLSTIYFMPM